MVMRRGYPCQTTRRLTPGFVSMNTTILTLGRLPVRAEHAQASHPHLPSTTYAQSVENHVEERTYDARASKDRCGLIMALIMTTGVGMY